MVFTDARAVGEPILFANDRFLALLDSFSIENK